MIQTCWERGSLRTISLPVPNGPVADVMLGVVAVPFCCAFVCQANAAFHNVHVVPGKHGAYSRLKITLWALNIFHFCFLMTVRDQAVFLSATTNYRDDSFVIITITSGSVSYKVV